MIEEQKRQFFSMNSGNIHQAKVSGKFGFSSLPNDMKDKVRARLAEKDDVMKKGLSGVIPGMKINGKEVTRELIKELEISAKPKEKIKEVKETVKEKVPKYVKEDLEKLSFSKLKKIAKTLGETGRSKTGIIKDILKHN